MPSRTPPNGRTRNPRANVASASDIDTTGLPTEKNTSAMTFEKQTYAVKSNHSKPLPITDATSARRTCRTSGAAGVDAPSCSAGFIRHLLLRVAAKGQANNARYAPPARDANAPGRESLADSRA